MTISRVRPRLAALLTAVCICVGWLGLSIAPVWAAAGTITEFPLPQHGVPNDITTGPDGNVWFTDGLGQIGRITPSGTITEFPVPGSGPEGITTGPDGNLWFTEQHASKIGRITTS